MILKLERPHYSNLWVSEFPVVALHTINIAGKYDIPAMHLCKTYEELQSFKPRLEALKLNIRRHAAVVEMEKLDSERDTLIVAFCKAVNAMKRVKLPNIQSHVELLTALIVDHRMDTMARANRTSQTERIVMLEQAIDGNEALQDAIKALALEEVIVRIFDSNYEYNELFAQYIADTGCGDKEDTKTLRKDCTVAIGLFFDAIEYCAHEYEDVDYLPLANELNRLNVYYITQLKARATRNKNRKNGDKTPEEPILPPEELVE